MKAVDTSRSSATPRSPVRFVYLTLGIAFTGLGILGAFLPVLPTTPLLLVALWAYAKSSPRLERWLLEHPRLGPPLVEWRAHRVVPLSVKLTAWTSMLVSVVIMFVLGLPWPAVAGSVALMAIGAIYIASLPSRVPPTDGSGSSTPSVS